MKRFTLSILLVIACIAQSVAAGRISVSAANGLPGDTVAVQISVSGISNAAAAEFNVALPDGLEYVSGSFAKENNNSGMTVSDSYADRKLRVLLYNTTLADLPLTDGGLFSFRVVLGELPGVYEINPSALISNSEGKSIDVTVSGQSITILGSIIGLNTEILDFGKIAIRSDYDKSFEVKNTGTSSMTVSSIKSSASELTVSDKQVVIPAGESKVINVTLSPMKSGVFEDTIVIESDAVNGQMSVAVKASAYSVNELHATNSIDEAGNAVTISVDVDNMEPLSVMQCSFRIPDGMAFVAGSFRLTERGNGMKSFCSEENGILKLYVYSDAGKTIAEGHGMVGSFKLNCSLDDMDYDLIPDDVILGDAKLDNVVSKTEGTRVSIKGPDFVADEELDMGRVPVNTTSEYSWIVKNPGRKDLIIEKVEFSDSLISVKSTFPLTVRPGAEGQIRLQFNSKGKGSYSAKMSVYSNCPDKEFTQVMISGEVYEPNNLSIKGVLNTSRREFNVQVGLSNTSPIHALQFNLYGVEELDIKACKVELSERCHGFSTAMTKSEDGSVQVLLYSLSDKAIEGNDGNLFSMVFSGVDAVSQELKIKNIVMSDNVGNNISTMGSVSVVPDVDDTPEPVPGDANGDGVLNIADVSAIVGYIYGNASDSFNKELADINKNGIINVADITIIVEEIGSNAEK